MRKIAAPTSWLSKALVLIIATFALACATARPSVEFVLAREALQAAKESESARVAPGHYHKAEEAFRRGVQAYQQRAFDESVEYFKESRINSEKAENASHLQRFKTGEEAL
ncbi:MAG: DUF4398 domain-containing protein [Oligoflexia bacterium]|nr:DUF4398 domain-containing protein [Oligoflexia bacterium]